MYSRDTCTGYLYYVFFLFQVIIFVLIALILFARFVRLCNRDMLILVFISKSPISFFILMNVRKIVHLFKNNIRISINKLMY